MRRHRGQLLAGLQSALVLSAFLTACAGGISPVSHSQALPAAALATAGAVQQAISTSALDATWAQSAALKAPLSGLIDMQDINWHGTDDGQPTFVIANVEKFKGIFGGIVINATWSQMQPAAGTAPDFSAVDAALASIRKYNRENPKTPIGAKLRVYGGNSAPSWAKQLSGGPVTIYRNPAGCDHLEDSCPLTIGLFWTQPYITAWRSFQARVAAKYDSEPLVRAVAITSCASQTDEPFVPTIGPISKLNMAHAATPYSDAAEQACLSGAVEDYSAWHRAQIDFTFNVYSKFAGGTDPAFTESVMAQCRTTLAARCVLDNHALQSPLYPADAAIYAAIKAAGGLINFQTQSPEAMGCLWKETVAQGVGLGARAIELWPETKYEGFDTLKPFQVRELASEFTSPEPPSPATPLPTPCSGFH